MIFKLIPKKLILYIVAAVILLGTGAFGGYTFCKRAQYKGVIKQQQKDAKAVLKHQEVKDNVEKKFEVATDKVKTIKDSTGCLDKSSGDDYLNELLKSDSISESFAH